MASEEVRLASLLTSCDCTALRDGSVTIPPGAARSAVVEIDPSSRGEGAQVIMAVPVIERGGQLFELPPVALRYIYEAALAVAPNPLALKPPYAFDTTGHLYVEGSILIRDRLGNFLADLEVMPSAPALSAEVRHLSSEEVRVAVQLDLGELDSAGGNLSVILRAGRAAQQIAVPVLVSDADPVRVTPASVTVLGLRPQQEFRRQVTVRTTLPGFRLAAVTSDAEFLRAEVAEERDGVYTVALSGRTPASDSAGVLVQVHVRLSLSGPFNLTRIIPVRFVQ